MVVLVVALLVLLASGVWLYRGQEQCLRQETKAQLQAIAALKVGQIAAWRSERLGDAAMLTESPFFVDAVAQWMAAPQAHNADRLLTSFRSLQQNYHYRDVLLVDAQGEVRLSLGGSRGHIHECEAVVLAAALRARKPVLTDLHAGLGDLPPHLDVIAPLFPADGKSPKPVRAVILQCDAQQFLFPLVESWPTPSRTAETLLVRRDGDAVLFLNELRHQPGTAMALRIPLSRDDVPAVMAVKGWEGVVQGEDYRGVDVFSVLKAVPDSPWFMIAKVDAAEALATWRFQSALILGLVLTAVILAATAVYAARQSNAKAHWRALFEAEAAWRRAEARYRVTLMSVGDGVITTNAEGRVELLNSTAEALTGWTSEEARGHPLEEVFRIVNEETRAEVEDPVARVLREGAVVGLANHTLLIARDGTERPIGDSGAPVRGEDGAIFGTVLVFRDQTEQRAAEKALRAEKDRARQYLDVAGVMMVALDANANVVLVNKKGCEILGCEEAEILGKNWFEHFLPERVRNHVREVFGRIMAGQLTAYEYVENVVLSRSGEERLVAWHNALLHDPSGAVAGTLSSGEDITEREQVEEALRATGERLQKAQKMAHIGNWEWSVQTGDLHWEEEDYRIFGLPRETIPSVEAFLAVVHPDDLEFVKQSMADALNGKPYDLDMRIRPPDGTERVVHANGEVTWDAEGRPVWFFGTIQDVTDRKRAEEALRHESAMRSVLLENLPCIALILRKQTREIVYSNEVARQVGAVPGKTCYGTCSQRSDPCPFCLAPAVWATNSPQRLEVEYRGKYYEGRWMPLSDDLYVHYVFDITERKRAEEKLLESEAWYRTLFEQASDYVLVLELRPDGVPIICDANAAALRIHDYSRDELIGKPISMLDAEEDVALLIEQRRRLLQAAGEAVFEVRHRRKGGSVFTAEAKIRSARVGSTIYAVSVERDITDRIMAEEALRESQRREAEAERLAAVGRMAARVAHEINNPLAGIRNSFRLVRDAVPADHPDHDMVERIEREIDRIANIVRQMYILYSPRAKKTADVVVADAIRDVLLMLEPLRRECEVEFDASQVPPGLTTRIVEGSLHQILYNLLTNAVEASPRGGMITLSAKFSDDKDGGGFVELAVRDKGRGIPLEIRRQIFEPFFTSKEENHPRGGAWHGAFRRQERCRVGRRKGRVRKRAGRGNGFPCVSPSRHESEGTAKWTALDRSCWSTMRRPSGSRPPGCCGDRASIAITPATATARCRPFKADDST